MSEDFQHRLAVIGMDNEQSINAIIKASAVSGLSELAIVSMVEQMIIQEPLNDLIEKMESEIPRILSHNLAKDKIKRLPSKQTHGDWLARKSNNFRRKRK